MVTQATTNFAIVALVNPERPLVLTVSDDFTEIVDRGRTLRSLRPGYPLQVVWGVDGRPVTAAEVRLLSHGWAWAAGARGPAGELLLGPVHQAAPRHPRQVRTDLGGRSPEPRKVRPAIEEISVAKTASELVAEVATLLLRRERRACDNLGANAPKPAEATDSPRT